MPVKRRVNFLHLAHFSRTGKMPVKRRVNFLVGWAGEPAHKRLIENGAISQFKPSILVEKPGFSASVRKS
jgi:hypothetical protein